MKQRVAFIGAGSHSDAVKPHLDIYNYEFVGYFDDKDIEEYKGYPILGKTLFDLVNEKYPDAFINIVSREATILTDSSIKGKGIFISRCFIGSEVEIYDNSIVNTGAIVEHHTVIAPHCNVTPGAILNFCKLGDGVYVGSGSTIIQLVEIAPYTIIGAGATVVKTIKESGTYVGVPARRIK